MDDDSTMDITCASPDARLGGSEAPNVLEPLEEQAVSITHPPPMTSSVAFIGINFIPSADSQMSSHRSPPDPTPWESAALESVGVNVVTGHPPLPPKPYVMSGCLLNRLIRNIQASEAKRTGFLLLFRASTFRLGVLHAPCWSNWSAPSTRDCPCRKGLFRG